MLSLIINNFKCFHNVEVPLNRLTILVGANGYGKSTVVQALLFLRRTIEHCARWNKSHYVLKKPNGLNVELNGPYCLNLGNSGDVLPIDFTETLITFGLVDEDESFTISYSTNKGSELYLTPVKISNKYKFNPLNYQEFYYLNAERIGPRLTQSMKFYDYPCVGSKGEYTAQVISELNYKFKVEDARINKEHLEGSRLEHHINAWLDFIMPGTAISPIMDEKIHTARIEVENNYSRGNTVVPTNTGFGISYALPIIVSGLIAVQNSFLIVENPEAHLHPSAQSKMGYFLATIANAGVRVIIETHSDYIVNGIQIAAAESKVNNDDIIFNFFSLDQDNHHPTINPITINSKGELSDWPKGFFDQSQINYSTLLRLRKNV